MAAAPGAVDNDVTSSNKRSGRPWWPRVKRIGTWVFFGLVAWLIVEQARGIDWDDVLGAFSKLPAITLAMAAALAAASFLLYSSSRFRAIRPLIFTLSDSISSSFTP